MEIDPDTYEDKPEDEDELEEEQIFISKVMRGLKLSAVEALKEKEKEADDDDEEEDKKEDEEFGKHGYSKADYQEVTYHHLHGTDKNSKKVEIKTYAPKVFLDIRSLCKVSTKEFLEGWDWHGKDLPLPKPGAGRSGSLFITAKNRHFIFKTIPHFEVETLVEILPYLHKHYNDHPDSRIARFLGLYRFQKQGVLSSEDMHVIIMTNMLYHPGWPIHFKYDLKGRKPKPGKASRDVQSKEKNGVVLKDNDDLTRKFNMDEPVRRQLLDTLHSDVEFLLKHNCMDYSLLVGVHQKNRPAEEPAKKSGKKKKKPTTKPRAATVIQKQPEEEDKDKVNSDGEQEKKKKKKKENGEKESKKTKKKGKKPKAEPKEAEEYHSSLPPVPSDEEHQEIYFIGIIDPLSRYNTKKKIANLLKKRLWEPETLSTIPAPDYAKRYLNYLDEIFPPKEDPKAEEGKKRKKNKKKKAASDDEGEKEEAKTPKGKDKKKEKDNEEEAEHKNGKKKDINLEKEKDKEQENHEEKPATKKKKKDDKKEEEDQKEEGSKKKKGDKKAEPEQEQKEGKKKKGDKKEERSEEDQKEEGSKKKKGDKKEAEHSAEDGEADGKKAKKDKGSKKGAKKEEANGEDNGNGKKHRKTTKKHKKEESA